LINPAFTRVYILLGYTGKMAGMRVPAGSSYPHERSGVCKAIVGNSVISVDTKKKELTGNFKNGGKEWHGKKNPDKVADHDFPGEGIPQAHPYGIYDVKRDEGFVNLGSDHDTAQFAVASIREWREKAGKEAYPRGKGLKVHCQARAPSTRRLPCASPSPLPVYRHYGVISKNPSASFPCVYPGGKDN
jgi:hypothetical protein